MMAASLAWSTSVTKSFTCFCEMRTDSTSSAARLMMAPAARAALTATLSMGCRLGDDIDCWFSLADRPCALSSTDGGATKAARRCGQRQYPDFTWHCVKTRFILLNTSHAGNVGAAARAMKTMGFGDLVLVAP